MATGRTGTWALGCGGGCVLLGVVVAALALGGVILVRDSLESFDDAVKVRAELEGRHGAVGEFVPWAGGEIPPERIESFLAVRRETAAARRRMAEAFAVIPMSEDEARKLDEQPAGEKVRGVVAVVRSTLGMGARIGGFFAARNRGLEAHGMGLGEYTYLYTVVYHSWLGRPVDEGPITGRDRQDRVTVEIQHGASVRRLHDDLVAMLRNGLESAGPGGEGAWAATLSDELEAMAGDGSRVPWQDGLPPATVASLDPYRSRLEAAYDPVSNPFELAINTRDGWDVTAR